MTIRSIVPADIPHCARLFTDVFSNPPWSEHWTQQAAESGISRLYTLTARNTPAQDFYAKHDFYVSPKIIMMAHRLRATQAMATTGLAEVLMDRRGRGSIPRSV